MTFRKSAGGSIAVAISPVVFADSRPEFLGADLAREACAASSRPSDRRSDRRSADLTFRQIVVHHGDSGRALFRAENRGARLRFRPATKASRPSIVLRGQQREIGGEAFAQPGVVPVLLGDRIAEPLVRDLVRHQPEGRPPGDAASRRRRSRWRAPCRRPCPAACTSASFS